MGIYWIVWLFVARVWQLGSHSLKAHHEHATKSLQRSHMRRRLTLCSIAARTHSSAAEGISLYKTFQLSR